ncbi:MAG: menaquinone biosynthesis decarboxylase, partial [Campylobacter sp.]|nr:menaquinone biosynthesis decarboxylase [Campylobacter sp.]
GGGQMIFVKHAIFVDESAPYLIDYQAFARYVLNRLGEKSLLFSEGVCDQLDHASPNSCFGGKLGIDATSDFSQSAPEILSDEELLSKFKSEVADIAALKQHFCDTKNPLVLVNLDKSELVKKSFERLLKFKAHFKILIFTDIKNDLDNLYMSVWRIVNNIDALRDVFVLEGRFCIDATSKEAWEEYERQWPDETMCSREVVNSLIKRGIIEDEPKLFKKFEIF